MTDALAARMPTLRVATLAPWLVVVAAVALVMADTIGSMIAIWARSGTFAHCYFILPIVVYMLWEKARLEALPPRRPAYPALLLVAGACLMWNAAVLMGIQVVAQAAVVFTLIAATWVVFGTAFVRYAAYPLAVLILLVPFGEGLIPYLIEMTTDFVVQAIRAIGIPVYRENNLLVLPTGRWSVVTACSGIRYLLATLTVSTVFAFFTYRTAGRRAAFIALAIGVAIVGNWLRALGIVLIGHYSGNRLAVGVDHLIYGWGFFGVLVVLLVVIGNTFADPAPLPAARPEHRRFFEGDAAWRPAVAVVVVLAGALLLDLALGRPVPAVPGLDVARVPSAPVHATSWRPEYRSDSGAVTVPVSAGDLDGALVLHFYDDQNARREMVTSTNVLVGEKDATFRRKDGVTDRVVADNATGLSYAAYRLKGPNGELEVREYWLTRAGWTRSAIAVKRQQLVDRLLRRPSSAMAVFLAAPVPDTPIGDARAEAALDRWQGEMLPKVEAWFEAAARPLTDPSAAPP